MNYDKITDPISPDAPCGPDLLAEDDEAFLDYYYEAAGRMPEKYFDLVREELFDPRSVDFKAEEKQIDGLLKRTRDLRLLGMQARFQILAGRLDGFCDTFAAIADLMEAYPDDVHPRDQGDNTERRNALEELNTLATVTMPLQYATLVEDRRSGMVNQRMYLLATGQVEPRDGEELGDAGTMLAALSSDANKAAVDKTHAKLTSAAEAIARIIAVTKSHAERPFTPDLEKVAARLTELLDLVHQARPDLGGADGSDDEAETDVLPGDAPVGDAVDGDSPVPAQSSTLSGPVVVPNHSAARRALEVAEQYFARKEPSAAALLLVTQARLLIGRPLVEALDTLLPNHAQNAVIDFGAETGFVISMDRLRSLSSEVRPAAGPDLDEAEGQVPDHVDTRIDAATLIKAVEDFYRRSEPVSPIPILLLKARGFLDKDFHAIVKELMPLQSEGNSDD